VERYVQTLTHELKSPLAAIHGAAELLRQDMSPAQRDRFLTNIELETARLKSLSERLLHLAQVEQRRDLEERVPVTLQPLVDELMAHPYFKMLPPKSTGKELFGPAFAEHILARGLDPADCMATLTAFSARSIADSYRDFAPDVRNVYLSGGGAHNKTMIAMLTGMLQKTLPQIRLHSTQDLGLPSDSKEAIAFALLGYQLVHGRHQRAVGIDGDVGPHAFGGDRVDLRLQRLELHAHVRTEDRARAREAAGAELREAVPDTLRRHHVVPGLRPAVEAGERLGFLPGDFAQKVDPYLRPLYDALYDLMGFDKTGKLFERNTIEIAPLAYMRGRTLNHSFIILDEAQNTTPEQMKMFLTRIGFGTKAVITGDITQIDLGRGQKSGLIEAERVLRGVRGIAFVRFTSADVVRHPLVQKIIDAYERDADA
jgi:hypothetical protein